MCTRHCGAGHPGGIRGGDVSLRDRGDMGRHCFWKYWEVESGHGKDRGKQEGSSCGERKGVSRSCVWLEFYAPLSLSFPSDGFVKASLAPATFHK